MPKTTTINVSDDTRHAIANAIYMARTHDMPDRIRDENLPTSNAAGLYCWNDIHKRIDANLEGKFQVDYIPRGGWKIMLLYDSKSDATFSVMSEKNFLGLQKRLPKNIHYIEALVLKNQRSNLVEGQIQLDGYEAFNVQRDTSALEALRNKCLNNFAGAVQRHMMILFDYNHHSVISVRAVLLTPSPELGIAYSEDWSENMKKPYLVNASSFNKNDTDCEPLVKLKTEKQENISESLVSIPIKQNVAN